MTRREWLALTATTPLMTGSSAPAVLVPDSVQFECEDLPQRGLVLVTPNSSEYDALLADIQQRQAHPAKGSPNTLEGNRWTISAADRDMSAILVNRSQKTVVSLEAVWRFDRVDGSSFRHAYGLMPAEGLLLPFGWSEDVVRLNRYWKVILPGSKRYLSDNALVGGQAKMIGDNTDVRPPRPDEKYNNSGGGGGAGGSGGVTRPVPIRQVTLILDGVFFDDGEFVGPNREGLWERTVSDAEAHTQVAKVACDGHNNGLPPDQIVAAVERLTGPAPEHMPMAPGFRGTATLEEYRQWALQNIAFQIGLPRRFGNSSDDREVSMLMGWTDVVLPKFRRE